jgi:hypothetical protein
MQMSGSRIVGAALVALIATTATSARAGDDDAPPGPPQPIIAPEGARREGPIARQWIDLAVTRTHLESAIPGEDIETWSVQLAAGPKPVEGAMGFLFGDFLGWLDRYGARVRWPLVVPDTGGVRAGPLTFAAQRVFEPESVNVPDLLHLHAGLELAFATPWLSGRRLRPPVAYQRMYAVETELSHNGYSLRPIGAYLRADLFVCRSFFVEGGLSPEAFWPTDSERFRELGVRWHFSTGLNLACSVDPDALLRRIAVAYEVRGRFRLDSADGSPHDDGLQSVSVQYHWGTRYVVSVFGSRANGVPLDQYFALSLRLQVGLEERVPR